MRKVLLFVLLFTSVVLAQTSTPVAAKVVTVHASGSTQFNEADILKIADISVGSTATPADFKAAADKLADYGAFASITYKYTPSTRGYVVEFEVEDSPDLLPVSFGNFVWFTPEQLNEAIRSRVPIYTGQIVAQGRMLEDATAALQDLINQRGIKGNVDFRIRTEESTNKIIGGTFHIEGLHMRIKRVFVTDAGSQESQLQTAVERLVGKEFDQAVVEGFAVFTLKRMLMQQGYLEADFGEITAALTNPDPSSPEVAVTIPTKLGPTYRIASVEIAGNSAIPTDAVSKCLRVKTGDVANGVQIENDLSAIRALYGTKGHLKAKVEAVPELDKAAALAKYRISIAEGDVFTMGKFDITGVNPAGHEKLINMWKLRPGQPFDTNYEGEYMKTIGPLLVNGARVGTNLKVNDDTKSVDLVIQLSPM